jgi:hypothetical protein
MDNLVTLLTYILQEKTNRRALLKIAMHLTRISLLLFLTGIAKGNLNSPALF